jgi:hypothetical protein
MDDTEMDDANELDDATELEVEFKSEPLTPIYGMIPYR